MFYGSNMKCCKRLKKVVIPEEIKEELIKIMKERAFGKNLKCLIILSLIVMEEGELHEDIQS